MRELFMPTLEADVESFVLAVSSELFIRVFNGQRNI